MAAQMAFFTGYAKILQPLCLPSNLNEKENLPNWNPNLIGSVLLDDS